jgi:hypothetical protein
MKFAAFLLLGLGCVLLMVNYEQRMGFLRIPVLLTMLVSYSLAIKDLAIRFGTVRTPRLRLLVGIRVGLILCLTLVYCVAVLVRKWQSSG